MEELQCDHCGSADVPYMHCGYRVCIRSPAIELRTDSGTRLVLEHFRLFRCSSGLATSPDRARVRYFVLWQFLVQLQKGESWRYRSDC